MNKLKPETAVGSTGLLGEWWTPGELLDAACALGCVYEGVDCPLSLERMRELEKRGLVTHIEPKRGRGRYANRYEYMWTDKLERLVKAYRSNSHNTEVRRADQ